jgi:hypothetical protein
MHVANKMPNPISGPYALSRHLFGFWLDLLLLGGGSIFAFMLLQVLQLSGGQLLVLSLVMLGLANIVNHPHFAHSYQIFYGSLSSVRSGTLPVALRRRWWLVGFIAPALLGSLLFLGAYLWVHGQGALMAVLINAMGALVGWHYVKQGFGMAMTDAAIKKCYWPASARTALLWNAYACWGSAWVAVNIGRYGVNYWGLFGLRFKIPDGLALAVFAVTFFTSAWCAVQIHRSMRAHRQNGLQWAEMPWAGVIAYVVALYLWSIFSGFNPAFALVIPFFHSLQYLVVVWRYKINEATVKRREGMSINLWRFAANGLGVGFLGFWFLPALVHIIQYKALPELVNGTSIAVACAWLFINVHHYLIDNVLWRQGNPSVNRYLFQSSRC